MNRTLLPIRIIFIILCAAAGLLVCYSIREWDSHRILATFLGLLLGVLLVLVDVLLRGFSLRGLSAITFGLLVGLTVSFAVSVSPLLETGDPQILYLVRLGLFLGVTYLCTVIALRGKDEFNLVIPYVRFVPHEVDVPLVILDISALTDGRIARICRSGFMPGALVIPRFILRELQAVAESHEPHKKLRGRRGLDVLGELKDIKNIDIRINESEAKRGETDAKLVFLAVSMKAKILTTDRNLMKMAEFQGVICLHPGDLAQAVQPTYHVGETIELVVIKPGKEEGQAVGYLPDGTMVVVNDALSALGQTVSVEIISLLPSGSGRIIFARNLS